MQVTCCHCYCIVIASLVLYGVCSYTLCVIHLVYCTTPNHINQLQLDNNYYMWQSPKKILNIFRHVTLTRLSAAHTDGDNLYSSCMSLHAILILIALGVIMLTAQATGQPLQHATAKPLATTLPSTCGETKAATNSICSSVNFILAFTFAQIGRSLLVAALVCFGEQPFSSGTRT